MSTIRNLAIILCMSAAGAHAQSIFGEIRGTITDPSNAVVNGAKVTTRAKETGELRLTKSDGTGSYSFVNLDAGTYEVEFEMPGFLTFRTQNLLLRARDVVRVDGKLQIATTGTEVQVSEARQVIETEVATVSNTRTVDEIDNMPVAVRAGATNSVFNAIAFAPGVQADRSGTGLSIGGGMPFQATATVDGISNINVRSNGINTEMFPSTDSISELKISSLSNNAEFSQQGDVTVTSRAGTNQYHGQAVWFHQNGAFDARDFFANRIGAPFKVSNDVTFSGGGPVIKNKTFFFATWEGLRYRVQRVTNSTVPPAAWRNGDLSSITTPIINPANNAPYPGNQIPVNPIAKKLLDALYPLPNIAGNSIATTNYRLTPPGRNDNNQYDIRVDHVFSARNNVFGRFSNKSVTRVSPTNLSGTFGEDRTTLDPRNVVVAWNFIASANKVNEFRFGYSNQSSVNTFGPNGGKFDGYGIATGAGIQGISANAPKSSSTPAIGINGLTGASHGRESLTLTNTWQFGDNFSWINGRHTTKIGVDIRKLRTTDITSFFSGDDLGEYSFDGFFSGNAMADFLLGLPHSTRVAATGKDTDGRTYHYGIYGQDDFRVNKKLTLNFGVRYEAHPMFNDKALTTSNFDRNFPGGRVVIANAEAAKLTAPAFRAAIGNTPIVLAEQTGLPETLRFTDWNNFAPRFGFAYRPNSRSVIRGGYGIYTATILGSVFYTITGIHVSDVRNFTNTSKTAPTVTLQNPFGGVGVAPVVGSADFRRGTQWDGPDPYSQQWNVTYERDLGWNTGLRLTYTGNTTHKMYSSQDLNQVRPNTVGYGTAKLSRPFPNWNIIYSRDNLARANYQGATVELNKRMSKGLSFQGAYTWAKHLTNATGSNGSGFASENGTVPTDNQNIDLDYGNVATTRRHRAIGNFLYQIPVLASMNTGLGKAVLGGWTVSGVLVLQSGPFVTATIGGGTDPSGTNTTQRANDRPDYTGTAYGNRDNPTVDSWFDRSAFAIPASNIGRFGYAGTGTLIGPPTRSFSARVAKTVAIWERVSLGIEATANNLTNTANFDIPALNVSNSNFGRITSTVGVDNGGSRTLQVGARIRF